MRLTNISLYTLRCGLPLAFLTCAELALGRDLLDLSLEELMQVKVSGATLRDDVIKNVPSAVTVFTAEQINQLGMDYLYELLNLVPGFQFARNGDAATDYAYSARGRRVGGQSREILVLVDGRDFSDPRFYSADITFSLFPLEFIERVEFIRGPSSALYGSNAINGTINIITRKNINTARVSLGGNRSRDAFVQTTQALGEWRADLAIKAYRDAGDDYLLERKAAAPMASSDPRMGVDINASIGNQRTTFRITHHQLESREFYVFETVNNDINYSQQLFDQFELEHQFQGSKNFSSKLSFNYLHTEAEYHSQLLPAGALAAISSPSSNAPFLGLGIVEAQNFRVNSANDWTINDYSSAQFGLSLLKNEEIKAQSVTNFNLYHLANKQYPVAYSEGVAFATQVGLEEVQSAVGIYGQYLAWLSADTRLTLGARYDDYADFGTHLSPRLGLTHQLSDQHTIKVQYGEAFRAPALSEVGVINNPIVLGNPNLTFETIKTWELIWQAQWAQAMISVDAFHSQYSDPISIGLVGNTRMPVNGSDTHTSGIEFEAAQEFLDHWRLRATYTRLLELPEESFREADQFGSVMLNFNRHNWNWNIAGVYQAERATQERANILRSLPAFWFADTKLSYQVSDAYEVHLRVKNLFDTTYATPAVGVGLLNGIPNRGREWSVGLAWYY